MTMATVSSAFQMAVSGSPESGVQIQYSFPFQRLDTIFVPFSQMKKDPKAFWLKNLNAIACHQWLFALIASILSLLNFVMGAIRLGRKTEDSEKEVIDSDETNLPACTHNLSTEELEDKLQAVEKIASQEIGRNVQNQQDSETTGPTGDEERESD